MQPQARSELRCTGIEFVSRVPWGTHICGFYESEQDYLHMVMTFFAAGAAAHEYCLWITDAPTLPALVAAGGQHVEVVPHTKWYRDDRPESLLKKWRRKVAAAVRKGYAGLRVVHSGTALHRCDRETNLARESVLAQILADEPVIALCPYPLKACSLVDIIELSNSHAFTFFPGNSAERGALSNINHFDVLRTATAEVVHEIRNPITAIRALMELLHSKPEFHIYSDLIGKVIAEVDRVDELACQFLSLARTCAPEAAPGCNLNTAIEAIRPLLEAAAAKRRQCVRIKLSPIPDILCRPSEARQVILILAQNAFEAMSADGVLTITTEHRYPHAVLRIQDTGCGIPPEIMPKVGIPFFTTKGDGTGLGLPVCFRILEKYHAQATIDSSKSGTTVTIIFPTTENETNKGPH